MAEATTTPTVEPQATPATAAPAPTPDAGAPEGFDGMSNSAIDDQLISQLLAGEDIEPEVIAETPPAPEPEVPAPAEPEPQPEPEPDDSRFTGSWDAIKREDKRLRTERDEMKAARQEIADMRAQFEQGQKSLNDTLNELRGPNAMEALEKHGIKFNDLADRVLNDGKPSADESQRRFQETVLEQMNSMREQNQALQQQLNQRDERSIVEDYRGNVRTVLSGEDFGLLRAYGDAEEQVTAEAARYAAEAGRVLTPAEAASKVQDRLREQLTKLGTHEAVRNVLGGATPQPKPAPVIGGTSQAPQAATGPTTLTNTNTASPTTQVASDEEFAMLPENEQIAHTLRLLDAG